MQLYSPWGQGLFMAAADLAVWPWHAKAARAAPRQVSEWNRDCDAQLNPAPQEQGTATGPNQSPAPPRVMAA